MRKHPDDDTLDRYALGRITDERELAAVEEHLLLCDRCRSEVILVDNLRAALAEKEAQDQ